MRRPEIWAGGFFVVSVIFSVWLVLYGKTTLGRQPDPASTLAVRAPTIAPTGPTPGAIGSTGRVATGGAGLLWVDETGLRAWNRALANRDTKAETEIMHLFETLDLRAPTRVRVTNRTADTIQVEITDGPYAGRRGWTDVSDVLP